MPGRCPTWSCSSSTARRSSRSSTATGPLSLKEILRIGLQIAAGLAAAHEQGLVHRDVKPANILLENGVERVKITDFGLARAVDDASLTQSGVVAGTPMYMSPEQAEGEPVDLRSDLFSLGSVLYALCTGRPPFRAPSTVAVLKRVCEETPRPIREINPDLPAWLEQLVTRLHAKNPADRVRLGAGSGRPAGPAPGGAATGPGAVRPAAVAKPPRANAAVPPPRRLAAAAAVVLLRCSPAWDWARRRGSRTCGARSSACSPARARSSWRWTTPASACRWTARSWSSAGPERGRSA